jgi:hypothetical protein
MRAAPSPVWVILHEDLYEAKHSDEEDGDDGRYIRGLALNSVDTEG